MSDLNKRLFVANISFNTTDDGLAAIFAEAGKVVSARVILDHETGRSRGFGFVGMSTDEETKKAIDTLHGKVVEGRELIVNEARPKKPLTGLRR